MARIFSPLLILALGFSSGCKQDALVEVIPQHSHPLYVTLKTPVADFVDATDSIYLEAAALDTIGNSPIISVQIYADNIIIQDFRSSPYRLYWTFNGLQDNSAHFVYAKAYDARGDSGQSPLKTVRVHLSPSVVYTPFLALGNRWFYSNHGVATICGWDSTGQWVCHQTYKNSFIVRQVTDSTSDGWRVVSVTTFQGDTSFSVMEYWINMSGKIYICPDPGTQYLQYRFPQYISDLEHDSSNHLNYSWHISHETWFGMASKTEYQTYSPYVHNGASETVFGVADGIGLVSLVKIGYTGVQGSSDTTFLVGAVLGSRLLGDTTRIVY